ncbi:unnamed protein product [Pleuronectes platessa]|uniref:Uncharacterized protein n=1 Tax=Pleuronectes platessa TaxID=8262 RepID=A0A9N7YMG7_PLEPL|nr:unnamed protein product [Pleuronectes platessa]
MFTLLSAILADSEERRWMKKSRPLHVIIRPTHRSRGRQSQQEDRQEDKKKDRYSSGKTTVAVQAAKSEGARSVSHESPERTSAFPSTSDRPRSWVTRETSVTQTDNSSLPKHANEPRSSTPACV